MQTSQMHQQPHKSSAPLAHRSAWRCSAAHRNQTPNINNKHAFRHRTCQSLSHHSRHAPKHNLSDRTTCSQLLPNPHYALLSTHLTTRPPQSHSCPLVLLPAPGHQARQQLPASAARLHLPLHHAHPPASLLPSSQPLLPACTPHPLPPRFLPPFPHCPAPLPSFFALSCSLPRAASPMSSSWRRSMCAWSSRCSSWAASGSLRASRVNLCVGMRIGEGKSSWNWRGRSGAAVQLCRLWVLAGQQREPARGMWVGSVNIPLMPVDVYAPAARGAAAVPPLGPCAPAA